MKQPRKQDIREMDCPTLTLLEWAKDRGYDPETREYEKENE